MRKRYAFLTQCKYLHESLVMLLITGPFAILLPKFITPKGEDPQEYKISPKIKPDIIFNYLLPPIIMSAGFNMRKKYFFKNLGYIGLFGFLGTILNFVIVTMLFIFVNRWLNPTSDLYNGWDIITTMAMSTTLIATDTIAPLTLIDQKKYPTLFSVVFGEGVCNDAVALLLMNVILGFKDTGKSEVSLHLILDFTWNFVKTTISSLLFGAGMGKLV